SDLLVIPFYQGKKPEPATALAGLEKEIKAELSSGDFSGKEAEVLITYSSSISDQRIALIGLGKKDLVNAEIYRRAFGAVAKAASQRKATSISIAVPAEVSDEELVGLAEGLL